MPSVGFTISYLEADLDPLSPELMQKWKINKKLFDSFFGYAYPLKIYRGLDDPKMIIAIGPFAGPEEHLVEFAQSEEMGDYLNEFGNILDLRGAFHLEKRWEEMPIDKEHLSIARYFVDEKNVGQFEKGLKSFAPNFLARSPGNARCSGWRIKGGWRDVVDGDDSKALGGIVRSKGGAGLIDFASHVDEDETDDTTREWVSCFGWGTKAGMDDAIAELQTQFDQRDESWKGLNDMVAASNKVILKNFVRIDYEDK